MQSISSQMFGDQNFIGHTHKHMHTHAHTHFFHKENLMNKCSSMDKPHYHHCYPLLFVGHLECTRCYSMHFMFINLFNSHNYCVWSALFLSWLCSEEIEAERGKCHTASEGWSQAVDRVVGFQSLPKLPLSPAEYSSMCTCGCGGFWKGVTPLLPGSKPIQKSLWEAWPTVGQKRA